VNRRRAGQVLAAFVALAMFTCAALEAHRSAIPGVKVYDGYWMILGAAIGMLVVGPLVWRWPRERSLVTILITAVAGSVAPLVISAMRHDMPLQARLRGAWFIGGADVVGPALVIGCMCLWFALRAHRPKGPQRSSITR
jgi:branched-subunit amino acid ABC-type transport system permease component